MPRQILREYAQNDRSPCGIRCVSSDKTCMLYRCTPPQILPLESRRLLAASYPTNAEQYLIELVNRARANPTAEAALFGISLNEGLTAGTISATAKQPLAINPYLVTGA